MENYNHHPIKFFLPVVFTLILLSCKHSDPAPAGNTDLISKTWKLTGFTLNGADAFSTLSSCVTDNLFIYTKDGKFTEDEGATKCDPTDPQTVETATWVFAQNGTAIKLSYPDGTSDVFPITQSTATTLKFTLAVIINSSSVPAVSTYTAQ